MSTKDRLLAAISTRRARVGIVGMGYVGLPLAMEFARAGFEVVGFDVSDRVVKGLNGGRSHILDVADTTVQGFLRKRLFEATTDSGKLSTVDAICIAVPTPLSKTRDPDMSFVLSATETVSRVIRAGQVIVLESTTYPGTTRELLAPALEKRGLKIGIDVFVAFSPERVDPGNSRWNTRNTPKVVGGITASCTEVAAALYAACIDRVVPVSSPEAAELTKLLENTFRAVNIGLVNEIAIVCDKLGVDVWEVIDAAATKPFGFMKFTPGPGIGGHCIPLDPHYLAWKMRTLNYRTRFIDLASEINSEMPHFVADKTVAALNEARKSVRASCILLLGIAYKPDINDVRESPALVVMRLLRERGADVVYHDSLIPILEEGGDVHRSVYLSLDELRRADAVVIVTDHTGVDYQRVAANSQIVVDTRNALARSESQPGTRRVSLSETRKPGLHPARRAGVLV